MGTASANGEPDLRVGRVLRAEREAARETRAQVIEALPAGMTSRSALHRIEEEGVQPSYALVEALERHFGLPPGAVYSRAGLVDLDRLTSGTASLTDLLLSDPDLTRTQAEDAREMISMWRRKTRGARASDARE